MKAAALLAVGLALGAAMPAGADTDLTTLEQRVATLEATDACRAVAPFGLTQLHGTHKRTLVVTNSGPSTLAHPSRFVWVTLMTPSCAKDIS